MNDTNRRSEPRIIVDEFYSIQFFLKEMSATYEFKLWDISSHGLCILIKNDSDILSALKVGDTLKVKYHPIMQSDETTINKTEIRHITPGEVYPFENYTLVGLMIIESSEPGLSAKQ